MMEAELRRRLRLYVRRFTRDAEAVEDAIQDAYAHELERERMGCRDHEGALFLAAKWAAIQRLRERDCEERYWPALLAERPDRVGPADGDPYLRGQVAATLGRLRREYAEVLVLRYVWEYSKPEIAAMLGISRLAVAARVDRGRDAFVRAWREGAGYRPGRYAHGGRDPETGRFTRGCEDGCESGYERDSGNRGLSPGIGDQTDGMAAEFVTDGDRDHGAIGNIGYCTGDDYGAALTIATN